MISPRYRPCYFEWNRVSVHYKVDRILEILMYRWYWIRAKGAWCKVEKFGSRLVVAFQQSLIYLSQTISRSDLEVNLDTDVYAYRKLEFHSENGVLQLNSLSSRILTIRLFKVGLSCRTSFGMSRAYRRSHLLPIHLHDDRSQAVVLQEQGLRLYRMEYLPSSTSVVDMISHNQQF